MTKVLIENIRFKAMANTNLDHGAIATNWMIRVTVVLTIANEANIFIGFRWYEESSL